MDASEWTGPVGDIWAQEWRRTDRTFAPVDDVLVAAAARHFEAMAAGGDAVAGQAIDALPIGRRPPPRLLEIGCGAGTTALHVAARVADAQVTGIDLSPALLAIATERAAGQPRCRFLRADASTWMEPESGEAAADDFDLILSRHGVMFFDDPVATLAHIRTLAKPGAPLIFTCFRAARLNTWASRIASLFPPSDATDPYAPGPFAFAEPERVGALLAQAGWRGAAALPIDFAYVAGAGPDPVADAIDFFTRIGPSARALRLLDEPGRARLLDGLGALVRDHWADGRVAFPGAAWIWTARA